MYFGVRNLKTVTKRLRFESRDHSFFCIVHRSHSSTHAVCPYCFDGAINELDALRVEKERLKKEALLDMKEISDMVEERKIYKDLCDEMAKFIEREMKRINPSGGLGAYLASEADHYRSLRLALEKYRSLTKAGQ